MLIADWISFTKIYTFRRPAFMPFVVTVTERVFYANTTMMSINILFRSQTDPIIVSDDSTITWRITGNTREAMK